MAMSVVPPEEVTDLVAFRPSLVDSALPLQVDYSVTGYVSQCGTEVTLCSGSRLWNYQAHTGRLCSELRLGKEERPLAGPFVNFVHSGKCLVAVAVQGGSGGPLLCVCHPSSGRVVRAVHLTAPATHLALVSGDRLGELTGGGWVALATADRRLLLLGLCLDSGLHYSNEDRPAKVVAVEGLATSDVADLSPAQHGGPVHPCVHICDLDDLVDVEGLMPGGEEDLEVTCLEWLPQLGCLAIGQACGNVHIWDVETLSSVLAMSCASDLPVVSLVVQEPENDPRCFCYLWVAQGTSTASSSASTLSCFSTTTMHSLSFQRKEIREDGRYVYRDFHHARPMFEYPLVPDVVASGGEKALGGTEEMGSRIISFRTVPPPQPHAVKTAERQEDLGVLLLCWQLLRAGRVVGSYLSVFDINQWYRAQMPHTFRLTSLQQCSYMGLFSLGEAVANCGGHALLDVRVPPSSVKKFVSSDPLVEQAHYPSSLAFSCVCLTAEGMVHASYLGMQRQLLHNMNVEGPHCLNEADDFCARLSAAGLVGDSIRSSVFQQGPAAARARLLNVALEHRMVGFLVACLKGPTKSARDSADKPLLPFVLKWTWSKVKEIKGSLDKLYMPLFDCSGQDVTAVEQRMAVHLEELNILHRLLEHACGMNTDDPGLVEVWRDVAGLLAGHLRVLLFLLDSKVLPDRRPGPGVISYPGTFLRTWCLQARRDLGSHLLVDALVEAAWAGTEEEARLPFGGREYPPSGLQLALEVYLCRELPPWAAHALTYYLLLDTGSVCGQHHPSVEEKLGRFPAAFAMGADLRNLVEGIWSIDHNVHKEGLEQLQRAHSLATPDIRPLLSALWGPVVRMLLRRGDSSLALCGLQHLQAASTPEELALQLDVLLANSRAVGALELVRKNSRLSYLDQLLGAIVALVNRRGKQEARRQLDMLLQVPLSAAEEAQLTGFFCELADPSWLCQVALHFLQCGRPHAALPLTTTIREIFREGSRAQLQRSYPEEVRKQAAATLELMQSFLRLVPLPPSQQRGARNRRDTSGVPVRSLGTVSARVPHRGTTPRLVSRVSAVRATLEASEASSRPALLPRPTDRQTPADQHGSRKSSSSVRRHSLHFEREAEALSILQTPPVQRWQGPVAEASSAGPASSHTPASILKRRTKELPPLASTPTSVADEGAWPLTPLAADDVYPLPVDSSTVRKLRFAVSDTSLSETGLDLDTSARSAESSELDQSKERSSPGVSFAQSATEGSSDPSSQFVTASESDEESGTELQEDSPEPERAGAGQSVSMAVDSGDDRSLETAAGPSQTSFTGLKDRLPAFLLQEAARCLPGSSTLDASVTGSPGKESLLSRGPRTPSPLKERLHRGPGTPSPIGEDLDGTPLADDDEGSRRGIRGSSLDERDAARGGLTLEEEDEEEEREAAEALDAAKNRVLQHAARAVTLGEAILISPVPRRLFPDRGGTALMEEVSKPSSEESAMSLRVPVFDPCEEEERREAVVVEEVIVISASEASDSEKPEEEEEEEEDEEIVILSDNSSEMPRRRDGTESREADWSRSPPRSYADRDGYPDEASIVGDDSNAPHSVRGVAANEGGDGAVLTELGSMQPILPLEPLEVAREASLGLLTPAADVEVVEVERSLSDDNDVALRRGSLPAAGSAHPPPSGFPVSETDAHFRGAAGPVNVSFGFVPGLDRSAGEDTQSSVEEIAAVVAGLAPSATVGMFMPQVVVERLESSPTLSDPGRRVVGDAATPKKAMSPQVSPKHSPMKSGKLDSKDEGSPKVRAMEMSPPASPKRSPAKIGRSDSKGEGSPAKISPPVSPKHSPPRSARLDSKGEGSPKALTVKMSPLASPKSSSPKRVRHDSKGEGSPKVQSVKLAEGSSLALSQGTVESSYRLRERRKSTLKGNESQTESTTPGRERRRKSGSVPPSQRTPSTPLNTGLRRRDEESAKRLTSQARKTRAASEEPISAHGRSKRRVSSSPPRKVAKKSSPAKSETPSPKRKAQTPSPRQKTQSATKAETPSPRGQKATTESPKRTPGRPKRASSVSRRLATPSPKKTETMPSPKKAAAVASTTKKKAAAQSPKKESPASPKKTPPLRSRMKAATPSPKKLRSTEMGTRRKASAVHSSTMKTPEKGVPEISVDKSETPIPAKKAVRRAAQKPAAPRKTPSPTKKTASSVEKESLPTPARRSVGGTPKERTATPTRSTSSRRKSTAASSGASLDTIAEVSDVFEQEEDVEANASTRTRRRSSSTLAAKSVQSARRSRRVSSGTALDTIAEAPAAEAEEEAATPARRGRLPSKRKAGEQAEAVVAPPSPKKRGRKLAEPVKVESPPPKPASPRVTRQRLQPKKGRSPATKSPSSGRGREEVPKTKRRGRLVIVPVLTGTPGEQAARTRRTAAGASPASSTPPLRPAPRRRRYKLSWKPLVLSVPASLSRTSSSTSSTSARRPSAS
ncbi:uncharacterized protein LOC144166570 isoform X2 [Haemaphysalis longicornis]